MITSLNIKNIATYDSASGVQIDGLKKVNFFFGYNGSGKSTIAKYLRNLSLETTERNAHFNNCTNAGYDNSLHQILTFNDEFIEHNFRKSPDFKGVFSLNETNESIDLQINAEEKNIEENSSVIDKYKNKKTIIESDKKSKSDALMTHCWNQRTAFSNFSKISLQYSGSKPNHLLELRRILDAKPFQPIALQELTEKYQIFFESDLKELNVSVDAKKYFELRRLETKLKKILEEVIIGNESVDIAALIQVLNSRTWVEQGTKLLQPNSATCPFCQKETIDSDLKKQFEAYFDETYKTKIAAIESLKASYENSTKEFLGKLIKIQDVYNNENIVSNLVVFFTSMFRENIEVINAKIESSNEIKDIVSVNIKKTDLSQVAAGIKSGNQAFSNSDSNKKDLIEEIWKYMAVESDQEIQTYDERLKKYSRIVSKCDEGESSYRKKIETATENIETLRSQTVNTKEAVDNINIILKNAGYEGFIIEEKEKINNISNYHLKRLNTSNSNPIFDSLSEGEKNFISFLYFYQLCLGTDDLSNNGSKKKLIVIDDPVSSLDSQALFIVSTLIHSLIQRKAEDKVNRKLLKNGGIIQVFIFTHNFYFYKEVSFEKRHLCTDYWHFKISKQSNQTSVTGDYNRSVSDDYSLMWKTIKDIKSNAPNNSSLNIMISNSMRRIIESYVNFVGYGKDSWASLLNENPSDPTYYIKCAFISTINDESHKVSAMDSNYYQKLINEQPKPLFDTFASIFQVIGKDHYEMMMDEQLN